MASPSTVGKTLPLLTQNKTVGLQQSDIRLLILSVFWQKPFVTISETEKSFLIRKCSATRMCNIATSELCTCDNKEQHHTDCVFQALFNAFAARGTAP